MSKYKKTIAMEEEVLDRAMSNLKEKFDIELSKKEMEELYNIQADYIEEKLSKDDWCTVMLPKLGFAYYGQIDCNKKRMINKKLYNSHGKEHYKEKADLWKKRKDKIEEEYQNNQARRNRRNRWRLNHVTQPLIKSCKRRGWSIEKIEDTQNKIGT